MNSVYFFILLTSLVFLPIQKGHKRVLKLIVEVVSTRYQIMWNCWQASPSLRPSFKDLRETFDKLLESETQYINLEDAKKLDFSQYENLKSEENISERYIVRNGNIL
ncbi:unnamed protein product [Ceutorhynchus assimilis]|uniref:Uncharacterized protein n=1 Tax=Ceutorhynchus assimilis TaxID=467358 RepID=A0A9N9MTG9_9CUCU|nr:unnamed protein product [Ceutorhynchus assimilis]